MLRLLSWFCFETVLQYFFVFKDIDILKTIVQLFWKTSLNSDLSTFSELDSGHAIAREYYESDLFMSVHLMRTHMGSICVITGDLNVDHLVKGGVCLVDNYISWSLQYNVELVEQVPDIIRNASSVFLFSEKLASWHGIVVYHAKKISINSYFLEFFFFF